MTDQEQADRELRALILMNFLGWSWLADAKFIGSCWVTPPDPETGIGRVGTPPDPLTDIAAAMEAVEAFVTKHGIDYGDFEFGIDDGKLCWNVVIGPRAAASAHSLPRAICLALAATVKGVG